jgi:predicted nucleic acid-binding protein
MSTLIDTGVLLRAFDANSPHYRPIRQALRKLLDDGEPLTVTVQNMAEFWNVGTRPLEHNGQGLSAVRIKRRVAIVERFCEVVAEDAVSYEHWKRMIESLGVTGVKVHDARLISVMLRSGVKRIFTLNEADFRRYVGEGIEVVTPDAILKERPA